MAQGETYQEFIEKFKPKHTTDDCYTPENIYNAICEYVETKYNKDRKDFIRPFWPGADYQKTEYPKGGIVVDNPPFSIMSEIIKFYTEKKIPFFLFANGLTLFSIQNKEIARICCGITITYQNGAAVNTGFLTNLEPAGFRTDPELFKKLDEEDAKNRIRQRKKKIEKRVWPAEIATAAMIGNLSTRGVKYAASVEEYEYIRKYNKITLFGGGYTMNAEATKRLNKQREELKKTESREDILKMLNILGIEKSKKLFETICKEFEKGGKCK